MRVLEGIIEPPERIAVLEAVLRHREVVRVARLEDHLRRGDLDRIEDPPRSPARLEQRHQRLDDGGLPLADDRVDQHRLLGRGEGRVLTEQLLIAAVEQVLDDVAAHLVGRVPARAHRHVGHARIEHAVRRVPTQGLAQLDRGARPVRLVAGRVRPVVQHPVLHVDQPGEGQLGEHLLPVPGIVQQA